MNIVIVPEENFHFLGRDIVLFYINYKKIHTFDFLLTFCLATICVKCTELPEGLA